MYFIEFITKQHIIKLDNNNIIIIGWAAPTSKIFTFQVGITKNTIIYFIPAS